MRRIKINEIPVLFGLDPIDTEEFRILDKFSDCLSFLSSYIDRNIPVVLKEILASKYLFLFDNDCMVWKVHIERGDMTFVGYFEENSENRNVIEVEMVS